MRILIIPTEGTVIRDSTKRRKMFQSLLSYLLFANYQITLQAVSDAISHIERIEENIKRNARIMGFRKKVKILAYLLQRHGFEHISMGKLGYLWTLSYFYHPPFIDMGTLHALKELHLHGVKVITLTEASDLSEGATRRLLQKLELPLQDAYILGDGEPSTANPVTFKNLLRQLGCEENISLVGIASNIAIARAMLHAGITDVALLNRNGGETILQSLSKPEDIMDFVLKVSKI